MNEKFCSCDFGDNPAMANHATHCDLAPTPQMSEVEEFNMGVLKALGLNYQDGYRWVTIRIDADCLPSICTEQFTRDIDTHKFVEVGGKLSSVFRKYKLVLVEEKNL